MSCAKTDEPVKMSFWLRTRVCLRKHVLGGVHTAATWRIEPSMFGGDVACCQITLTTCYYCFCPQVYKCQRLKEKAKDKYCVLLFD